MTAKNREAMIEKIMNSRYQSDDPKYDASNRAFLNSLSTPELEKMSFECDMEEGFEDEVELEGEIRDENPDDLY